MSVGWLLANLSGLDSLVKHGHRTPILQQALASSSGSHPLQPTEAHGLENHPLLSPLPRRSWQLDLILRLPRLRLSTPPCPPLPRHKKHSHQRGATGRLGELPLSSEPGASFEKGRGGCSQQSQSSLGWDHIYSVSEDLAQDQGVVIRIGEQHWDAEDHAHGSLYSEYR